MEAMGHVIIWGANPISEWSGGDPW